MKLGRILEAVLLTGGTIGFDQAVHCDHNDPIEDILRVEEHT